MKCILNPEIENISGKSGGLLYRTYTRANGKKETRVYILPRKENGKFGYTRKAAYSENELASKARFAQIAAKIKALSDEQKMQYQKEWVAANYKFNGKKYCILRGYIMARLYDEMKKNTENGPQTEES